MRATIRRGFMVLIAALLLSPAAAAAPPPPPPAGERPLEGIERLVRGSTLVGAQHDGIFVEHYAPDGSLQGRWRGEPYSGTWSVERTAEGERLCTRLPGAAPDCLRVSRDGPALLLRRDTEAEPLLATRFNGDLLDPAYRHPWDDGARRPFTDVDTPQAMELSRVKTDQVSGTVLRRLADGVVLAAVHWIDVVRVHDPRLLDGVAVGQSLVARGGRVGGVFEATALERRQP